MRRVIKASIELKFKQSGVKHVHYVMSQTKGNESLSACWNKPYNKEKSCNTLLQPISRLKKFE